MITKCEKCGAKYEDEYRSIVCPHNAFPANDGNNVFTTHDDAYLEQPAGGSGVYDADYFLRGKETGKSLYSNYRWLPELTLPMVNSIIAHLGIKQSDTILDFGCARGYTVKALRQLGYNAYGYDISQWALENADPQVRGYLIANESTMYTGDFDWVIAKDVLEHVRSIDEVVDMLKYVSRVGVFAVVPLAHCSEYDVPDYEKDVTHVHRRPLSWWVGCFHQSGWSVEGRYRVNGVKDNYAQYPMGNGFITARRI